MVLMILVVVVIMAMMVAFILSFPDEHATPLDTALESDEAIALRRDDPLSALQQDPASDRGE